MRPPSLPPASRARGAAIGRALAAGAVVLAAGCSPATRPPEWALVREITPRALVDTTAREPGLATDGHGGVALTWVTSGGAGGDVWVAVSRDSGQHFSPPRRLDSRSGCVDSAPENRPVAIFGATGELVVAWAAARERGPGDDIVARASADGGAFGAERFLDADAADTTSRFHGAVALGAAPGGRLLAAWLEDAGGPEGGVPEPPRAALRLAASEDGGRSWSAGSRVADDVCACCRVALQAGPREVVALAFRSASEAGRDVRLALSRDGGASFGVDTLVSADHWRPAGCPATGPALAFDRANGGQVAWYTGSEHVADGALPGAYVTGWRLDGALSPLKRELSDSLSEAAEPLLAPFGHGVLAGVVGRPVSDSTRHVLALRVLEAEGGATPWIFLGARAQSGAVATVGSRTAYAAWVERGAEGPHIRVACLTRR